ncbi:hypothetical protein TNCV_4223631 [Trichonephila clavipes]|nr:hypothetical protein TNCV_4223631 [Trichonephila clavipes]
MAKHSFKGNCILLNCMVLSDGMMGYVSQSPLTAVSPFNRLHNGSGDFRIGGSLTLLLEQHMPEVSPST